MTDTVLVSEWFPPAVGGSAELLANVYARWPGPVSVLTSGVGPAAVDQAPWAGVTRVPFTGDLGVVGRRALGQHTRLVRQIGKLGRPHAVIHCGRAVPEGTAAMVAGYLSGRPYTCWTHGEELPIVATSRELSWLQARVHRRAAALLANSRHTADLLVDLGNPAGKIHVVHPGVDHTRFRPASGRAAMRARLAPRDELVILTVGRLQARKGQDLVLRALALTRSTLPPVRYVIVGDGPEGDRLRQQTAELGLGDLVTFAGTVASAELPDYYGAADLFVHPNRIHGRDFEGFGLVFLEAAAAGLPAIGGRSGGVAEAVADGTTGWLVSGDDPAELGRRMVSLLGSAELRTRMGRAARERVIRDFTWERAARRVASIDARIRADQGVSSDAAALAEEGSSQP